jgi:O-antigen/teichoic acid export membrane protein
MKATSLFGGVQVINIIVQVLRSKVIAILLGPAGLGIIGLLNSTVGLIGSLSDFGLGTSAVREVSSAYSSQNNYGIAYTLTIVRRLVWLTGTIGTLLVLLFSPWLSQLAFGNRDYSIAFIWISITLLFQQLTNGQFVILQGMRKLNLLAKANVLGSTVGLILTLPFYYFYGTEGIVPGIVGTSFVTLLLAQYFSGKINIEKVELSYSETFAAGKGMLRMGFMISLSTMLTIGASFLLRIFINRTGNVEQVGLYTAGFAIINTYVGLIFSAMGTDYFPRLSSVANDNYLSKQTVNQQSEIAILILAPILVVFLFFIKWVIIFLYSNEFIAINTMIQWAALGMFFKASSWAIGFIFLAKGASNLFFYSELVANIYMLGFNVLGYWYGGLEGLGISFFVGYAFYLIQVYSIANSKYLFSFDRVFIKIFLVQFSLSVLAFICVQFMIYPYTVLIGMFLVLISSWYSFQELDSRLGLKTLVDDFLKKQIK